MATLDVNKVTAVGFPVDTTVTAPDGNTFVAPANTWFGIPHNQGPTMTVTPAGLAMCMTVGSHLKSTGGDFVQVMTVNEVRTSA